MQNKTSKYGSTCKKTGLDEQPLSQSAVSKFPEWRIRRRLEQRFGQDQWLSSDGLAELLEAEDPAERKWINMLVLCAAAHSTASEDPEDISMADALQLAVRADAGVLECSEQLSLLGRMLQCIDGDNDDSKDQRTAINGPGRSQGLGGRVAWHFNEDAPYQQSGAITPTDDLECEDLEPPPSPPPEEPDPWMTSSCDPALMDLQALQERLANLESSGEHRCQKLHQQCKKLEQSATTLASGLKTSIEDQIERIAELEDLVDTLEQKLLKAV